jgi:GGDEF domain-containing protein
LLDGHVVEMPAPEIYFACFGSNEFTVLIEDVENPADAVRVSERIIEALREPFVVPGRASHLGYEGRSRRVESECIGVLGQR